MNQITITKDDCLALVKRIKYLRTQSIFYKDRLRTNEIAIATGIPRGSIGSYIAYDSLPTERYTIVKLYIEKLEEDFKKWIEVQNG